MPVPAAITAHTLAPPPRRTRVGAGGAGRSRYVRATQDGVVASPSPS
jgi:hypothetical protein